MNLATLVAQGFEEMQEDVNDPQFWSAKEVRRYIFEGFREIVKKTEINLTSRAMPLYAHVKELDQDGVPVFESFSGYFVPPVRQIQRITDISWVGQKLPGQDPIVYPIEVLTPEQMDKIDPNWELSTETADVPKYAIEYSGNYNVMNMQQSPYRNRIKIRLYPTPNDLDPTLQTALTAIQGMEQSIDGFNLSVWGGFYGGLASSETGGVAWGLDNDGDGEPDNGIVPGSTAEGIIVDLIAGTFDITPYGNYPKIRYQPDFKEDLFYAYDGTMEDLDDMLPYDLQIALRNYMVHRCFRKESEARDKERAKMYKDLYDEAIEEYQAMNHLYDNNRMTPDSNILPGTFDNTKVHSRVHSYGYNELRL